MVSKALFGGLAAAVVALGIVFWLLLGAKEANGKLAADIDRVAAANAKQRVIVDLLKLNALELIDQIEKERNNTLKANEALLTSEQDRERDESDFQDKLAKARAELTHEELVCANELVPAVLVDSLRN